jgi:hypothetical protein
MKKIRSGELIGMNDLDPMNYKSGICCLFSNKNDARIKPVLMETVHNFRQ